MPALNSQLMPEGARDLLPADLLRQESLRHRLLDLFASWGYQAVLPPTLESLRAIEQGRPKFLGECFRVIDQDGQLLALRPDLTLPIARLAATRLSHVPRPLRLCYATSVFRRTRQSVEEGHESYQAGIELIGWRQPEKENLECVSILMQCLRELGLAESKVVLSHSDLNVDSEVEGCMSRGDFVSCESCLGLTGEPSVVLSGLEPDSKLYRDLESVVSLEKVFGPGKFLIDLTMRPDRDFYTGLYFEVVTAEAGKPIGKGGRYDNLIESFGESEPSVGFSLALDALLKYCPPETHGHFAGISDKASVKVGDDPLGAIAQSLKMRTDSLVVTLE